MLVAHQFKKNEINSKEKYRTRGRPIIFTTALLSHIYMMRCVHLEFWRTGRKWWESLSSSAVAAYYLDFQFLFRLWASGTIHIKVKLLRLFIFCIRLLFFNFNGWQGLRKDWAQLIIFQGGSYSIGLTSLESWTNTQQLRMLLIHGHYPLWIRFQSY